MIRQANQLTSEPSKLGTAGLSLLFCVVTLSACGPAPADVEQVAAPAERAAARSARPTPRYPDGRVRLDRVPGEKGYWGQASVSSLVETGVEVEMDARGLLADIDDAEKIAPFRPWALALYRYRQQNGLEDDPTRYCLPPAGPRHLHTPGGFRIVQDRNFNRVYVMFGGGNRNWRVIFLDGRAPPDPEEVFGTYYGHSTGEWQDDTLTVQSSGFNERFWFSNGGLPHTEALRLTERFSRPDFDTLKYEVTIDDPLTYTRPWTAEWTVEWVEGGEIKQQFCEDNR
jgi:hypothetical protein